MSFVKSEWVILSRERCEVEADDFLVLERAALFRRLIFFLVEYPTQHCDHQPIVGFVAMPGSTTR